MNATEPKTCQCEKPVLRVYATTYTLMHKVQYQKCKLCNKPAGKKKIETPLSQRVSTLEALFQDFMKNFRA